MVDFASFQHRASSDDLLNLKVVLLLVDVHASIIANFAVDVFDQLRVRQDMEK